MSEWGAIVSAIEAHCRVAMTDLPAGQRGFEYAQGFGETLAANHMPHVFTVYPLETVERADFLQREVALAFEFALWTRGETLEELSLRLDAIVTRLATDPTLGGLVDDSFVSARDAQGIFAVGAGGTKQLKQEKVANFVVSTARAA